MTQYDRDYLIIDTDSILNNADSLMAFLEQVDTPALFYSERGPIWDTLSAPFTYLPNTDTSRSFVDHVYRYLVYMFFTDGRQPFWYIDQLALLGGYLRHNDEIRFCPSKIVSDVQCGEEAIFWTLSNDKNHNEYVARCEALNSSEFAMAVDS